MSEDQAYGIAAAELRQFIEQIEQGEAEKADAAERVKEIYAEAKARGYSAKAMRDAQGMIWQQDQPAFGTRLEVQWSSSLAPGWAPEFGAIGLQLEGNSRLLLRARGGGPMLYYRTKF